MGAKSAQAPPKAPRKLEHQPHVVRHDGRPGRIAAGDGFRGRALDEASLHALHELDFLLSGEQTMVPGGHELRDRQRRGAGAAWVAAVAGMHAAEGVRLRDSERAVEPVATGPGRDLRWCLSGEGLDDRRLDAGLCSGDGVGRGGGRCGG